MRVGRAVVISLLALAVTGCAGTTTGLNEQRPWVRPMPAEAIGKCLQEQGWQVTVHPDNSSEQWVPEDQAELFDAAQAACAENYFAAYPPVPVDSRIAEEIWDGYLWTADCLESMGIPVDPPPSREFAIDMLQQQRVDLGWDPHAAVSKDPRTKEFQEAWTECPAPVF